MALNDRAAAIAPYAEQLLHDSDVQASARDAAQATWAAYQRARGKDAQAVMHDRKFRRQVNKAAGAISGLWGEVQEPPPRRRWGPRVLLIALLAGLLFAIVNETVRDRLRSLLTGTSKSSESTFAAGSSAPEAQPISPEQNGDSIA